MTELWDTLSSGTVIQISRTGSASHIFPWAMIYEYTLEDGMPERYTSCRTLWEEWNENAIRDKPVGLKCPRHEEHLVQIEKARAEGRPVNLICPYGFWGLKHIIEQPLSVADKVSSAVDTISTNGDLVLSVGISHDIDEIEGHLQELQKALSKMRFDPIQPADDRDKARVMLRSPKFIYFLCHGEHTSAETYISIGWNDKKPIHTITPNAIRQWKGNGIDVASWKNTHPLVFINGCGTADLRPGLAFEFVSTFAALHVCGVIGTEIRIQTTTAYPAAQYILKRFEEAALKRLKEPNSKVGLGQIIREMRWELLNKGDLLGLAYTPYGLADLHVV
jgi:hypothetical protein